MIIKRCLFYISLYVYPSFRVRPVAGTTRRGYDLANILEVRVRDKSPEFRVRLVAGTSLQGYDSSNFLFIQYNLVNKSKTYLANILL